MTTRAITRWATANRRATEAIVTQLVNRSAKADYKAIQILLGMLRDIEGNTDPHPSDAAFTEADLQIIQRIRTRLRDEKE